MNEKIEIPLSEYNQMKKKISELENTILDKNKQIETILNQNQLLTEKIEDIKSLSLIERIFKWNQSINN